MSVLRHRDGYRYVREYRHRGRGNWPGADRSWALWERQNGRARRVGTARTEAEAYAFLGLKEPRP